MNCQDRKNCSGGLHQLNEGDLSAEPSSTGGSGKGHGTLPQDTAGSQNRTGFQHQPGLCNHLAWSYLEPHDACPVFAEEDGEVLKNTRPDFIGFNYYSTVTAEAGYDGDSTNTTADQQPNRIQGNHKKVIASNGEDLAE